MKLVTGQYDEVEKNLFEVYKTQVKNITLDPRELPPFIISMDTINLMNADSWDFLIRVIGEVKRLAIIL